MSNQLETSTDELLEAMRQREREYLEGKRQGHVPPTPEQQQALTEYWDRVFSASVRPAMELVITRNVQQEMEYMEARRKFWHILQLRAAKIEVLENRAFNWEFDDGQKKVIQNLLKYFVGDPSGEIHLTKGVFIYGATGAGKTEVLKAFEQFCFQYKLAKEFKVVSMSEIYTAAKSGDQYDPITPNVQGDKGFDEFGRYTGPVMRFGEGLDINEAIIEQRYERHRRYGQLTHFIANATPNELQGQFSPMIFDRLRSMCTGIHFTGQSKR